MQTNLKVIVYRQYSTNSNYHVIVTDTYIVSDVKQTPRY